MIIINRSSGSYVDGFPRFRFSSTYHESAIPWAMLLALHHEINIKEPADPRPSVLASPELRPCPMRTNLSSKFSDTPCKKQVAP